MTYATWNPADKGASCTLSGGDLTASANAYASVRSTLGVSSGKHYFEVTLDNGANALVGVGNAAASLGSFPGADTNGWGVYKANGYKYNNGSQGAYVGAGIANGATVGIKLNLDDGELSYIVEGVDKGVAFSGLSGTFYAMFGGGSTGAADQITANFGASAFVNSVPAGYRGGLFEIVASGFTSTAFGTPTAVWDQIETASGFTGTQFGTPLAIYDRIETASGFQSGAFGTPTAVIVAEATGAAPSTAFGTPAGSLQQVASGFTSTQFGTPALVPNAVGFRSTQFGTPYAVFDQVAQASGFQSGALGTPSLLTVCVASSLGPTAIVPMAYYQFDQVQYAEGAHFPANFGIPTALQYILGTLDRNVRATGSRSTRFGTPAALPAVTAVATGFSSTAFGTPDADATQRYAQASALEPGTAFGTPTVKLTQRASGFRSTAFGTPTVRTTHAAQSVYRATRFGLPVATRSNTYVATGINCSGKFGRPRAIQHETANRATGICATQFGTPIAVQSYRAKMLAPVTRFGTPQAIYGA